MNYEIKWLIEYIFHNIDKPGVLIIITADKDFMSEWNIPLNENNVELA